MVLAAAAPARAADAADADRASVRRANDDYVRAFLESDLARFRQLLSPGFTAVLADGRQIDRAEFLRQAAVHPDAQHLRLRDVSIRLYGDAAVLVALVDYAKADGTPVRTRYTAVFSRHEASWVLESVQWTRVLAP